MWNVRFLQESCGLQIRSSVRIYISTTFILHFSKHIRPLWMPLEYIPDHISVRAISLISFRVLITVYAIPQCMINGVPHHNSFGMNDTVIATKIRYTGNVYFSLNLLTFFFFLLLLLLIQSITTGVQSDNCNIISCVYRGRNRATTLIIMNSNKLSTPDMNPIAKRGHCCD